MALSFGNVMDAVNDVRAEGTATTWVLFTYDKQSNYLKISETGEGGLDEVEEEFNDGRVQYAYLKYMVTGVARYVYIAWCGEGVTGMRKGMFAQHAKEVGKQLQAHVTINARSELDINDAEIRKQLSKAMGANYDAGERIQGAKDNPMEARAAPAPQRAIDSFVTSKEESKAFWDEQRKKDEETAAALREHEQSKEASLADGRKAEESRLADKFKQMEMSAPAPAPSVPAPAPSVPAPAPAAPAPAPAAPAPSFGAPPAAPPAAPFVPPPAAAEPEPAPEPEPEPEPEPAPAPAAPPAADPMFAPPPAFAYPGGGGGPPMPPAPEPEAAPAPAPVMPPAPEPEPEPAAAPAMPPAPPAREPAPSSGVRALVLYDYDPQEAGELMLREDQIVIVEDQDDSGWWTGRLESGGESGLFPGNYVELQ